MRLRWKELFMILNTASIAGIIIFLHYPDSSVAMIGGLFVFISGITFLLLQKAARRRRQNNY